MSGFCHLASCLEGLCKVCNFKDVSVFYFFLWRNNIPLHLHTTVADPSIHGWVLGSPHFLATVNNTAMNMHVHAFIRLCFQCFGVGSAS